ncbi:MAG: hypothetical protein O2821_03010 [Chloroflexi bacterium]|nr:hypothetical protein [Chloroflexota bacterium]MDA1228474.1 hypothetical protein [Chloroflexota bacterium]
MINNGFEKELLKKQHELRSEIELKERVLESLQNEIGEKREALVNVSRLIEYEDGDGGEKVSTVIGPLNWAAICRENGLIVGGDSAHRVVLKNDPILHSRWPHYCTYEKKGFPLK